MPDAIVHTNPVAMDVGSKTLAISAWRLVSRLERAPIFVRVGGEGEREREKKE